MLLTALKGEVQQVGSFSELSENIRNVVKDATEEEKVETKEKDKWMNRIESPKHTNVSEKFLFFNLDILE